VVAIRGMKFKGHAMLYEIVKFAYAMMI